MELFCGYQWIIKFESKASWLDFGTLKVPERELGTLKVPVHSELNYKQFENIYPRLRIGLGVENRQIKVELDHDQRCYLRIQLSSQRKSAIPIRFTLPLVTTPSLPLVTTPSFPLPNYPSIQKSEIWIPFSQVESFFSWLQNPAGDKPEGVFAIRALHKLMDCHEYKEENRFTPNPDSIETYIKEWCPFKTEQMLGPFDYPVSPELQKAIAHKYSLDRSYHEISPEIV